MTESSATNYGPLAGLIGIWQGNKGKDVSPDPDGTELNEFYETIVFTEAGDVSNAEEQLLSAVHYVQKVQRISNGEQIHHETGYWIWEQSTKKVTHCLVIPRGMSVLAAGVFVENSAINSTITFDVKACTDEVNWQLIQSPFMQKNARMSEYFQQFILTENKLSYTQSMILDIYGKVFEHTDQNTLIRQ